MNFLSLRRLWKRIKCLFIYLYVYFLHGKKANYDQRLISQADVSDMSTSSHRPALQICTSEALKATSPLAGAIKHKCCVAYSLTSFFSTSLTIFPAHVSEQLAKNISKFWTGLYLLQRCIRHHMALCRIASEIITGTLFQPPAALLQHMQQRHQLVLI